MASSGRKGDAESNAVIVASLVLVVLAGLVAIMIWQAWMIPRSVVKTTGAESMGVAAERQEIEEQIKRLKQTDASIVHLNEEMNMLRRQVEETQAWQANMQARFEEVGVIRDEHNRLQTQIEELSRHRAEYEARFAALLEPRLDVVPTTDAYSRAPPQALDKFDVASKLLHNVRVVDASSELGYVVLDVGEKDGVRPGMVFHVMDGDQVMASLRSVHVRDTLTGAKAEEIRGERFPKADDRVILRQYLE